MPGIRQVEQPPALPRARQSAARGFVRYAWAVVAYNVAVVLWGAFVRATGSGAGCGNHWPLCNGAALPVSPSLGTIIEFAHRATSGIDLALVGLLAVWRRIWTPRPTSSCVCVCSTP